MPEFPEVELMTRHLDKISVNKTISSVHISRGKYLEHGKDSPSLLGKTIYDVRRRGKFIVIYLNDGILLSHNAMSGFWDSKNYPWCFDYVEGKRKSTIEDIRISIGIGDDTLFFHDTRLFGSLRFYPSVINEETLIPLKKMGPEVIGSRRGCIGSPTWDGGAEVFRRKKDQNKTIKEVLMDQEVIAGVGNIYATETLWLSQINPTRLLKDMSDIQLRTLSIDLKQIIRNAIQNNLKYGSYLNIYRKDICNRCNSPAKNIKIKGRSTYYCSACQIG